jgi:hypothetical protein
MYGISPELKEVLSVLHLVSFCLLNVSCFQGILIVSISNDTQPIFIVVQECAGYI